MDLFKKYLQDNFKFSDQDWEDISEFVEPMTIDKGEYFVQQGKVCRRLAFIAEGVFRLCMERDGLDITCYFVSENGFVGDPDSFYSRKPSDKNIQALTDALIVGITLDNLNNIYSKCPRFKEIMLSIDHKVVMDLMTQRDFLQHADATAKYQHFVQHYSHILQRVPLGYVASFLGITQQSLSRLRKEIS
jgi:CRP/FNR family transcriptional regulator, anaerobic regulatory protein